MIGCPIDVDTRLIVDAGMSNNPQKGYDLSKRVIRADAPESRIRTVPTAPRRSCPNHEAREVSRPVGRRQSGQASFTLAALNLVQSFGEQRQYDHAAENEKSSPRRLGQSPKRVSEDSNSQAGGVLGLLSRRGREQDRLSRPGEKPVQIALRQQLARPLANFGADERELRMELPRFNVPVRRRLRLVYRRSAGPGGRLSRNTAKPGFELERAFEGDGSQVTRSYRR